MIQMPYRSVTRFFVPMIDVLTLLFCIYLLMPVVSSPESAESEKKRLALQDRLRSLEAELARKQPAGEEEKARLREEIERIRREQLQTRLSVRVLEIDDKTGKLFYRNPDRIEIRDQSDAQRLIDLDRSQQGVARRDLYYLILYPRDRNSSYPTREQRQRYDRWLQGVALGYDVPGAGPGEGAMNEVDILLGLVSDVPIKILAIVGGATLGAMLTGWLLQVIAKLTFAQQVPRWPLWFIRTVGGGTTGFLVYLWLFGGGGGGIGGPGGWFGGGGAGDGGTDRNGKVVSKDGQNDEKDRHDKSKDKAKVDGGEPPPGETLRVEVLGDAALKKIGRAETFDPEKRYRIEGETGLHSLKEVRDLILKRRAGNPPLRRLTVVVYLDSPARDRPQVSNLADWARDIDPERGKVEVAFFEPDRNAPVD